MDDCFEKLVNDLKNINASRPHSVRYLEKIHKILEMEEFMSFLQKNYNEKLHIRFGTCEFVKNINSFIVSGKKIEPNTEYSITNFLKHNLLQFSNLSCFDDKEVVIIHRISKELMNDYPTFLFICNLLDQDFMFSGIVKLLINNLVSKLLNKKVFVIPFKN